MYNVGGPNEMKNIEIVKLTIKSIHYMMTEKKSLREVLRKKELDTDGEIRYDWINDDLITFVNDHLGMISVMSSTQPRLRTNWVGSLKPVLLRAS